MKVWDELFNLLEPVLNPNFFTWKSTWETSLRRDNGCDIIIWLEWAGWLKLANRSKTTLEHWLWLIKNTWQGKCDMFFCCFNQVKGPSPYAAVVQCLLRTPQWGPLVAMWRQCHRESWIAPRPQQNQVAAATRSVWTFWFSKCYPHLNVHTWKCTRFRYSHDLNFRPRSVVTSNHMRVHMSISHWKDEELSLDAHDEKSQGLTSVFKKAHDDDDNKQIKAWAPLQLVLDWCKHVGHRFFHVSGVELVLDVFPDSNHRTKGNKAKCITNQRQPLHKSYCAYKGPQVRSHRLGSLPKEVESLVAIPDSQGELSHEHFWIGWLQVFF